ncbi:hypothetical protein [Salibaculum sp.]|uniref:hypothetical protein n=1 Tax=Salibaculum sp. TaxID=2855480 RepID=UPI002B470AC1|nr:hypothetical protein [Salibaculum sp.]HKL70850.1 hypothetical protein [Salibaculum sp.]
MRRGILLTALVLATTSGCARLAESPVNPLNWFGGNDGSARTATTAPQEVRPLVPTGRQVIVTDSRVPVQRITALSIERTPYGAIVSATGQADSPGYFNAELVPVSVEGGELTLELRAEAPPTFEAGRPARSRQVTVAYTMDAAQLATLRSLRVTGAGNSLTARP